MTGWEVAAGAAGTALTAPRAGAPAPATGETATSVSPGGSPSTATSTPPATPTGGQSATAPTPAPSPSATDPAPTGTEPGGPGETPTSAPTNAPAPATSTPGPGEETSSDSPSSSTELESGPSVTETATGTLAPGGGDSTTIVWNTPPAVEQSAVPGVMIAVAIAVLALAALVLALVRRTTHGGPDGGRPRAADDGVDPGGTGLLGTSVIADAIEPDRADDGEPRSTVPDAAVLTRFLIALGEGLIDCASPVAEVTRTLEEVGRVNGYPGTQVIALPTAILVTVPGAEQTQTAAASAGVRAFRLDQIEDVLQIAERARRGRLGPVEGMGLLQRAVSSAAPYPTAVLLGGYVIYSLGIALILGANLPDLLVAGVLGSLVAVVQLATARTSGYLQALVVLTSAFTVSAVVFGLVRIGAPIDVLSSLVPPLVMFLPGALLTTAVIDLATRQMIAGSARLAAGAMQLVLLALGISGAASLVGVRASAIGEAPGQAFGTLGPWLGVLVFVVGVALYHCVRLTSVPWVLAVVLVAYAGQVLGGLVFGGVMSALVGAAVMTPLALYAAGQRNGPPALVSFLPGFWVLVPGALGLIGVTQTLDGTATDGAGAIMTAGATMVAISLGVLVGIAVHGLAGAISAPARARRGAPDATLPPRE